jgi:hypothetical protein
MKAIFRNLKREKKQYDANVLEESFELIKQFGGEEYSLDFLQDPPESVHFEVETTSAFANAIRRSIIGIQKYYLRKHPDDEILRDDKSIIDDDIETKLRLTPMIQDVEEFLDEKSNLEIFIAKRNETSTAQPITVDDIKIDTQENMKKIIDDLRENLKPRVKKTKKSLEQKLLPLRHVIYGHLQAGKFLAMRLQITQTKLDRERLFVPGVQAVRYEILDQEPFNSETEAGVPSTQADPRKFRIGFETIATMKPEWVFRRCVDLLRTNVMQMKKDVSSYDGKEYFSSPTLEVKKAVVYFFVFSYGSFHLSDMVARAILENNREIFVTSTAKNSEIGCSVLIGVDDPKKTMLDAIDFCLSDIDAMEKFLLRKK